MTEIVEVEVVDAIVVDDGDAGFAMEPAQARELTDRIRSGIKRWLDAGDEINTLLIRAYHHGAWRALGYSSMEEYCRAEFNPEGLQRSRADMELLTAHLVATGNDQLPARVIAAAFGGSERTMQRVVKSAREAKRQIAYSKPTPIDPSVAKRRAYLLEHARDRIEGQAPLLQNEIGAQLGVSGSLINADE